MENFEAFNNFPGAVQQQQNNPNYQNVQNISETASVSVPEDLANFKNFLEKNDSLKNFLEKAEDGNRVSNMFWGHNIFDHQNQFPPRSSQIINPNNFGGGFVVPPREERRPTILQDGGLTYASLVPKNVQPKGSVGPIKEQPTNPSSSFGPTINYLNHINPSVNVGQTQSSYYGQNIPIHNNGTHNNSVGNYPNNPYYYTTFTGSSGNNGGAGIPFPLLTPPAEENNAQFAHGPSTAHGPTTGGQSAQQSSQVPNFAHQPNQQTHTYVRADSSMTNNVEEWQTSPPPSWNYAQTGSVNRKSEFCFFFNFE